MTNNQLDRRISKLEASAKTAGLGDAVHVAFVHPGEDAEAKVAALGPIRPGDQLIVVRFVSAADIQSPSTLQ